MDEEIERPHHRAETYYRALELGATFFRFTIDHMLYDLTFAQLLTLIEVRNERERRVHEEAERSRKMQEQGFVPPPKDITDPENLPSISDISRVFGGGMAR